MSLDVRRTSSSNAPGQALPRRVTQTRPEPLVQRNLKAHLSAVDNFGGEVAAGDFLEHPLGRPSAHLHRGGKPESELDQPMVEQRRAQLE